MKTTPYTYHIGWTKHNKYVQSGKFEDISVKKKLLTE